MMPPQAALRTRAASGGAGADAGADFECRPLADSRAMGAMATGFPLWHWGAWVVDARVHAEAARGAGSFHRRQRAIGIIPPERIGAVQAWVRGWGVRTYRFGVRSVRGPLVLA